MVTVTATMEDLITYDSIGLALYATPGADAPYWDNHPNFMYDECVATPATFEKAADLGEFLDDLQHGGENEPHAVPKANCWCQQEISIQIEMPASRL